MLDHFPQFIRLHTILGKKVITVLTLQEMTFPMMYRVAIKGRSADSEKYCYIVKIILKFYLNQKSEHFATRLIFKRNIENIGR